MGYGRRMAARRVLVVDDDDSIREVARLALELVGGWDVTTATTGPEGLERARELRPDVVVMDVMMPGMDGPTTFHKMQQDEDTKDIPVILLTAKVQAGDRREFDALGLAGVISKPFDPMTLAAQMAEILDWGE